MVYNGNVYVKKVPEIIKIMHFLFLFYFNLYNFFSFVYFSLKKIMSVFMSCTCVGCLLLYLKTVSEVFHDKVGIKGFVISNKAKNNNPNST